MRENGVKDFPDPANGAPLVDTNRIPSSATSGGMTILNAAMRKCGDLLAKAAAGQCEAEDLGAGRGGRPGCRDRHRGRGRDVQRQAIDRGRAGPPANTAKVERGKLSAMVSQSGTLTYRARPDGSPYSVVNRAGGTYTELPENGDKVGCGGVLYRVDDKPVLLLCGTVPAYRDLHTGDAGKDVRQLNRNLHVRGAGARLHHEDGEGAQGAPAPQGRCT